MIKGKHRNLTLSMVYDVNNVIAADSEARKGKSKYYGVRKFDRNHNENIKDIHQRIRDGTYHTGPVTLERRFCDKKWRILCKVHYYDHVAHHALMRVIMPVLMLSYHPNSAASITGRGVHYQLKQIRKLLSLNKDRNLWTAEIDFTKCYHHINRQRLYEKCCKTFRDAGIRRMLHDVINALGNHNGLEPSDGTEGVGIGLYPIQPLVNFYFNDLDRIGNSIRGVVMYRYCDNLYLIGFNLARMKEAISLVTDYINTKIRQSIHYNIAIQRIDHTHFVNAVGYKIYKTHTLLRNDTKQRFRRAVSKNDHTAITSYKGWLQHCNALHLWQTYTHMNSFSELNYKPQPHKDSNGKRILQGEKTPIRYLTDKKLTILDFECGCASKYHDHHGNPRTCTWVQVEYEGTKKFSTSSPDIIDALRYARDNDFLPPPTPTERRTTPHGCPSFHVYKCLLHFYLTVILPPVVNRSAERNIYTAISKKHLATHINNPQARTYVTTFHHNPISNAPY